MAAGRDEHRDKQVCVPGRAVRSASREPRSSMSLVASLRLGANGFYIIIVPIKIVPAQKQVCKHYQFLVGQ